MLRFTSMDTHHTVSHFAIVALFAVIVAGGLHYSITNSIVVPEASQDARVSQARQARLAALATTASTTKRALRRKAKATVPPIVVETPTATTTPTPPTTATAEIATWIYPGAPSCGAATEMKDGRKINVLKAEYFTIGSDGTMSQLNEASAGCNGYSATNIALLKTYSTSQYVTVSSADAASMETFFKTNGAAAVDTLVTFVTTNNITGVELDFEDFGSWSGTQYTLYKDFVSKLGNALHAKGKKLTIDGPAVSTATEEAWFVWRYQDFTALPVDQIIVMAYDYQFDHGAGAAIAPLAWMENVIKWTLSKYPEKSRISIGLPSYGYRGTEGTQRITIMTNEQLQKETGYSTATRDAVSGEMTWKNGTTRYFYQDSESLRQKRALVEKLGISSISIWHLGGNQWF